MVLWTQIMFVRLRNYFNIFPGRRNSEFRLWWQVYVGKPRTIAKLKTEISRMIGEINGDVYRPSDRQIQRADNRLPRVRKDVIFQQKVLVNINIKKKKNRNLVYFSLNRSIFKEIVTYSLYTSIYTEFFFYIYLSCNHWLDDRYTYDHSRCKPKKLTVIRKISKSV